MGGQATLFSSSDATAVTSKDIRVAVMHHAYTHSYPAPVVPFLAFTSALDFLARPRMTRNFYRAAAPNATADTDAASEKDAGGGGGGGGYGRGDGAMVQCEIHRGDDVDGGRRS